MIPHNSELPVGWFTVVPVNGEAVQEPHPRPLPGQICEWVDVIMDNRAENQPRLARTFEWKDNRLSVAAGAAIIPAADVQAAYWIYELSNDTLPVEQGHDLLDKLLLILPHLEAHQTLCKGALEALMPYLENDRTLTLPLFLEYEHKGGACSLYLHQQAHSWGFTLAQSR